LFASTFFFASPWHTCERQRVRAMIRIKAKDLFMVSVGR
jgi:hypothetical protein